LNGNEYVNDYCYVFQFDGARIAEATEYTDTAYAVERASAPAADVSG
jgi:ketosteroid isomerase-like protein